MINKIFIVFFSLSFSLIVNAQIRDLSKILQIGDSILFETIGSKYVKYYKIDSSSYYKCDRLFKKGLKINLETSKKLKGKLKYVSIRYSILYPEIKELSSMLYIKIDSNLNTDMATSGVPEFMLNNEESNFLSRKKIFEIRDSLLKEEGIKIRSFLKTSYKTHEFEWSFNNIIQEATKGKFLDGKMELLKLDPYTGEVIEHEVVGYGYVF